MRAMHLVAPGEPLALVDLPAPVADQGDLLLEVEACGVCRTDLHLLDGEVAARHLPVVPGHQIVGRAADGARFGVPWLGWTCGECRYCTSGRENLCPGARFTGRDRDGGYAELVAADERFCLPLPEEPDAVHLAPLLCAGLIGLRALRMTGDPASLALYGFGAAAHIVCQVAMLEGRKVYAVTRGEESNALARELGAETDPAQEPVDAAIIFAPAGALVPDALRAIAPGGSVVCAGIHMSDIPSLPYELLWGERTLRSVANLTRADGAALLELAPRIRTQPVVYRLEEANAALDDLRAGRVRGAAVLAVTARTSPRGPA